MAELLRKRLTIVESPFWSPDNETRQRFKDYREDACRDCLALGEAPFASHGFYTYFLDDTLADQRDLGIVCGYNWMSVADRVAVYSDLGVSNGMKRAIEFAAQNAFKIEFRSLEKWKRMQQ